MYVCHVCMLYKHDIANIIVRSTTMRNCGIGERSCRPQFDVTRAT